MAKDQPKPIDQTLDLLAPLIEDFKTDAQRITPSSKEGEIAQEMLIKLFEDTLAAIPDIKELGSNQERINYLKDDFLGKTFGILQYFATYSKAAPETEAADKTSKPIAEQLTDIINGISFPDKETAQLLNELVKKAADYLQNHSKELNQAIASIIKNHGGEIIDATDLPAAAKTGLKVALKAIGFLGVSNLLSAVNKFILGNIPGIDASNYTSFITGALNKLIIEPLGKRVDSEIARLEKEEQLKEEQQAGAKKTPPEPEKDIDSLPQSAEPITTDQETAASQSETEPSPLSTKVTEVKKTATEELKQKEADLKASLKPISDALFTAANCQNGISKIDDDFYDKFSNFPEDSEVAKIVAEIKTAEEFKQKEAAEKAKPVSKRSMTPPAEEGIELVTIDTVPSLLTKLVEALVAEKTVLAESYQEKITVIENKIRELDASKDTIKKLEDLAIQAETLSPKELQEFVKAALAKIAKYIEDNLEQGLNPEQINERLAKIEGNIPTLSEIIKKRLLLAAASTLPQNLQSIIQTSLEMIDTDITSLTSNPDQELDTTKLDEINRRIASIEKAQQSAEAKELAKVIAQINDETRDTETSIVKTYLNEYIQLLKDFVSGKRDQIPQQDTIDEAKAVLWIAQVESLRDVTENKEDKKKLGAVVDAANDLFKHLKEENPDPQETEEKFAALEQAAYDARKFNLKNLVSALGKVAKNKLGSMFKKPVAGPTDTTKEAKTSFVKQVKTEYRKLQDEKTEAPLKTESIKTARWRKPKLEKETEKVGDVPAPSA